MSRHRITQAVILARADVLPVATGGRRTEAIGPLYGVLDSGKFPRAFGFAIPEQRESISQLIRRLRDG